MFRRKNDEGVVTPKMLMEENQKLRQENEYLKAIRDNTGKMKQQYEEYIADLKQLKVQYMEKLADFDELQKKYTNQLNEMIKNNCG